MRRIHIVGISGRTGTTLLSVAMRTCFAIDAWEQQETSVFRQRRGASVYLTKLPGELNVVGPRLRFDPRLHVVCMVRDPRDIVVSKHSTIRSETYAEELRDIRRRLKFLRRYRNHPRFVIVRYEDLVADPSSVQRSLEQRMPFLVRRSDFRDFHVAAREVSEQTRADLRGLRPIETARIGVWRDHLPRMADQLDGMSEALIGLGYEQDDSWERLLEGVTPAAQGPLPESPEDQGTRALWIPGPVRRPLRWMWHGVRPWLAGLRGGAQFLLGRQVG